MAEVEMHFLRQTIYKRTQNFDDIKIFKFPDKKLLLKRSYRIRYNKFMFRVHRLSILHKKRTRMQKKNG